MYIISKVWGSNRWYAHLKGESVPICPPTAKKKALHIAADAMGLSFKEYMKFYRKEGKSLYENK